MLNIQTDILYFKKSLPFSPSFKQVLYVEDLYDISINDYLQRNYDKISADFANVGYEFCYFPYISKKVSAEEFVFYYTPYQRGTVNPPLDSSCLKPYLKRGYNLGHTLLIYDNEKTNYNYIAFKALQIDNHTQDLKELFASFVVYLSKLEVPYHNVRYCCSTSLIFDGDSTDEYADFHFTDDVNELITDVRKKIECLRQYGVDEMVLQSLLNPQIRLSILHITQEGRIFLPGYNNLEIKMSPLVKAVYFLFLRYPKGIIFKTLPDYRDELYAIYCNLTGRISDENIKQSIMDVTNPCKNSINEKCARIREAFVREFDERLARYYYVTGDRGTAKLIRLPRTMLKWDFPIIGA